MMLAHADLGAAASLAAFGTDWLYLLGPLAAFLLIAAAVASRGSVRMVRHPLRAFTSGAASVLGVPEWAGAPLLVLLAGCVVAVVGFFWDVAWHIAIGRDEFLFSPPHMCLLVGISLLGLAGLTATWTATRTRADIGWRVGRVRVPYGAAPLLAMGVVAGVGFGVDELWHWAYGLDVSMWSPPHLSMISAAAFSPMAGWLLFAEAGPGAGRRAARYLLLGLFSGATLVGLSAWQLEFDLGVPQWQQAFHPLLVALAGGFGLCAARAAVGPGGAVLAMVRFVIIRVLLALLVTQMWHLPQPRFVPYVAAALAVEGAFLLARRATPLRTALVAGTAVATVGLAGAALVTRVWAWNAWTPSLLRSAVPIVAVALAAAVLGTAFGRVVGHRPSGVRAVHVTVAFAVIALSALSVLPRTTPDLSAEVRTTPAGPGLVAAEVRLTPADGAAFADRFQVMAWQGGRLVVSPLEEVEPGRYTTREPVPVGGTAKSMVRIAAGPALGAIPISMPADPAIGAAAVPLRPRLSAPFSAESAVLLREAHDGPAWPGVVGYTFVVTGVGSIIGLILGATVALERRRRARGWRHGTGSLAGKRVVLTGSEGGIGAATRRALEAQGARVVGIDLRAGAADCLAADVRDQGAVDTAMAEAARRLGGVDIVIANAGIGVADDSSMPPDEAARRVMDVNFFGSWRVIAAAMPFLRASRGRVVVVGSGLARVTMPYSAAYTASKRALVGYADVLRLEEQGKVGVSVVQPAYIRTPIHDGPAAAGASLDGMARCETVEDAAAAIVAACETGRRELGSSPVTTVQLWAARHLPGVVDRAVAQRRRAVERRRPRPSFVRETASTQVSSSDALGKVEA